GMIILEDNPYGELRFAGQDIPTIKSMDEDGIVVYCSSFSKILSAGMRVGFLVAPDALMQKIVVAKQTNDVHTNLFFQMICARYMEHYDLDAQIQKVRNLYGKKCRLMLNALDKHMDKRIDYTRPEGGLFIWCRLPNHLSTAPLVKLAMERKVAIVPGEAFLSDSSGVSDGFRLNYSTPTEEQITRGIELLADAVAHYLQ
ncbi:MAG TPA: PLP-dependent aminotransferase family protein, partial [Clostridiales bacterium]|nr:PLP-dependent aminotransferase family protein [Clostridiales bacterium]